MILYKTLCIVQILLIKFVTKLCLNGLVKIELGLILWLEFAYKPPLIELVEFYNKVAKKYWLL